MLGNKSEFADLVKERVPDITTKHCVLHRHALAAKTLPSHFKEVLSVCVKVVNYIRGRPSNHRVFKVFCEEIGKKVEAFKKKLSLWKRRIQGGNVGSFPTLDEKQGDKPIKPMLVENIVAHLSLLETTMAQYFPMDHTFPELIQQPFLADMDGDDDLKEELIDLQVNQTGVRQNSVHYR
ncbi:hypothetical protein Pcinc_000834 [Petrolisthes cinctipes]|uniref:Uncharacterized protein n=1 Tax=Petrolisthes cinctipes TaxID=88211 RepID=A0AAE1L4K0_PETCI|nr:hypothetical protein Pcinc_000834 [Petrolisthes cinctipes]